MLKETQYQLSLNFSVIPTQEKSALKH